MSSFLKIFAAIALPVVGMLGCAVDDHSNGVPSDMMQNVADLQSIGPGVSAGENADQRVFYVESEEGRSWLMNHMIQEYDSVLAKYTRTADGTLVLRLEQLDNIMQSLAATETLPFSVANRSPTQKDGDGAKQKVAPPANDCVTADGLGYCNCGKGCACVTWGNSNCGCLC